MMSLWDALRMNMMISYQELVRTFLYSLIENNMRENNSLTQLRDTLLPKLLSGEITLPEAEQAVSEAENV
ncbi:hypothetical protein [Klebsiella quasipneumoniae]|uniref:hypothetical protein n=1 Tax=Klebsiella quasipneumoniae TaxID=1463165 RepID=UPI003F8D6555